MTELQENFGNRERLLETLKKLTRSCEEEDIRDKLDPQVFQDVAVVLEQNLEGIDIGMVTEVLRLLRISVVSERNRRLVGGTEGILWSCRKLGIWVMDNFRGEEEMVVMWRCWLQFVSNFMVESLTNAEMVRRTLLDYILTGVKLQMKDDDKVVGYSAMAVHVLVKLIPSAVSEIENDALDVFLQKSHIEFVIYLLESILQSETFMGESYLRLNPETRVKLIQFLIAHSNFHQTLPKHISSFFAERFKSESDLVLNSSLSNDDPLACWEVAVILELLCCLSSLEESNLKNDKALLTTTIFLFKSIHAIKSGDKSSESNNQDFSPVPDIDALAKTSETETMRSKPTYLFKAHLIRLLANLVHRNFENQETVRETAAFHAILDCCMIDARNPFITQWAVLAVRNACEGNLANQDLLKSVQRIDTKEALSKVQLIGL